MPLKEGGRRFLATANADLLERVYRGEFLERLIQIGKAYVTIGAVTKRRGDLPALARVSPGNTSEPRLERVRFHAAGIGPPGRLSLVR